MDLKNLLDLEEFHRILEALYGFYKISMEFDQFLMKFIGIYVLLDAVRAPLHLLDGRSIGDGADLAEITFIPEIVWVIFWLSCGLYGLYFLWKKYH